jgi:hypothetical protein
MPVYGMVITISDVELSAEQSERMRPALELGFGSDATTELANTGPYHLWRVLHTMDAPTLVDAVEGAVRMAREAREAAGLLPEQGVGFSVQLRDLTHPADLVLPPQTNPG